MASTYTQNSRIEKPATGDQVNLWGATENNNVDLLDATINGTVTIAMPDADRTLTVVNAGTDEARMRTLVLTGTLTAARALVAPSGAAKVYNVINNTNNTINLKTTSVSTTPLALAAGSSYVVATDASGISFSIIAVSSTAVYTTGTYTGTITGCTTAPTVTVTWHRVGNLVTLMVPPISALNGSLTTFTITGGPAGTIGTSGAWASNTAVLSPAFWCANSSVYAANMQAFVDASGTIVLCSNTSSTQPPMPTGWGTSGLRAWGKGATGTGQQNSGFTWSYLVF